MTSAPSMFLEYDRRLDDRADTMISVSGMFRTGVFGKGQPPGNQVFVTEGRAAIGSSGPI